MSAAVCGNKRSYFFEEDLSSPPSLHKKLRRCNSPVRLHSPSSVLLHLKSVFPNADSQLIERVVEECGNDLDSAIKSLHQHSFGSGDYNIGPSEGADVNVDKGTLPDNGDSASEKTMPPGNLPVDGKEWVDVFVREMMSASSVDDARTRALRLLEILEKSIRTTAAEEATQGLQKENMMLKEQTEAIIRENTILKRAVAIQHERQKEFDIKNQELQHLKQLAVQSQEKLRELEVTNYTLAMHLRQAQQSNPIPGRFHPDVF